jgi:hypothetical protein
MKTTPVRRQLMLAGFSLVFGAAVLVGVPQTVRADDCPDVDCTTTDGFPGHCGPALGGEECACLAAQGDEGRAACS